jgi:hypothetical protein
MSRDFVDSAHSPPEEKPIRQASMRVDSRVSRGSSITIDGLTKSEVEKLEAAILGGQWVRVVNGRLRFADALKKPPAPEVDPPIAEFWQGAPDRIPFLADGEEPAEQHKAIGPPGWSPSFFIQSVCGYGWSKENYAREAAKLARWGFECCRSRRRADGRFVEVWYLPGIWSAVGELGEAVAEIRDRRGAPRPIEEQRDLERTAIVEFLCRNTAFGTLDSTAQRAAMILD